MRLKLKADYEEPVELCISKAMIISTHLGVTVEIDFDYFDLLVHYTDDTSGNVFDSWFNKYKATYGQLVHDRYKCLEAENERLKNEIYSDENFLT